MTNRQLLERLLWKHTHRDYKGTSDGVRTVLHYVTGSGTCIVPVSTLTDAEIRDKLPQSVVDGLDNRPTLTADQLTALRAYATAHGRYWKNDLRLDWSNANAKVNGEVSAELQQVRNRLGPSWLNRFRFPKEEVTSL